MFSRKHPYLFFILVFFSVIAVTLTGVTLLILIGIKGFDFARFDEIGGEKVGIVEVTGLILDSKNIISSLKKFREDDSIKAIIVRIDSPGGAVGPSQEIFREIKKTSSHKKIVASMGSIAASGGYYIAAGADGIIANPGTITGSIGVIMEYTNFKDILDKIGLKPVVFKSGEYKDLGSPVRKITSAESQILQGFVNKIHKQFIRDVSKGRKMDLAKVEEIADGRIYTGEEAKVLGLIDRLGNFEDSIEWAGRMGGIKGKISTVYARQKRSSILEYLLGSSFEEIANHFVTKNMKAGYIYRP